MIPQVHLLSTDGVEFVLRNVTSAMVAGMVGDKQTSDHVLSLPFSSFVLLEFVRSLAEPGGESSQRDLLLVRPDVSAIYSLLGIAVNQGDNHEDSVEINHEIVGLAQIVEHNEGVNGEAAETENPTRTEDGEPLRLPPQLASSSVKNEYLEMESYYEIQIELNETTQTNTETVMDFVQSEDVNVINDPTPPTAEVATAFFTSSTRSDFDKMQQDQDNLTCNTTNILEGGEENWSMEVNLHSNRRKKKVDANIVSNSVDTQYAGNIQLAITDQNSMPASSPNKATSVEAKENERQEEQVQVQEDVLEEEREDVLVEDQEDILEEDQEDILEEEQENVLEEEQEDVHGHLHSSKTSAPGKEFSFMDSAWNLPEPQPMDIPTSHSPFHADTEGPAEEESNNRKGVTGNQVLKVKFVHNKNVPDMIKDVIKRKQTRKRKRGMK